MAYKKKKMTAKNDIGKSINPKDITVVNKVVEQKDQATIMKMKREERNRLSQEIKQRNLELEQLEKKKIAYTNAMSTMNSAISYLQKAKGEANGIPGILAGAYKGYNSKSYSNHIKAATENIERDINKINVFFSAVDSAVGDIEIQIYIKQEQIKSLQNQLNSI